MVTDELGYLPLPEDGASALFQVINQRYLKSSTILTANVAAAVLDRLLHRAAVVGIHGHSHPAAQPPEPGQTLRNGVNARVS
ncbi:ATP-binding protein [Streptomyces sp. NPDC007205]|uniref:ATP-binding protein n=1 Tax=Streptomyces sp. NPDC007205 TaxID=3154316 RepID=UPI0033DCBEE1